MTYSRVWKGSHLIEGVKDWNKLGFEKITHPHWAHADNLTKRLSSKKFTGYISCDECEVFLTHKAMPQILGCPIAIEADDNTYKQRGSADIISEETSQKLVDVLKMCVNKCLGVTKVIMRPLEVSYDIIIANYTSKTSTEIYDEIQKAMEVHNDKTLQPAASRLTQMIAQLTLVKKEAAAKKVADVAQMTEMMAELTSLKKEVEEDAAQQQQAAADLATAQQQTAITQQQLVAAKQQKAQLTEQVHTLSTTD